MLGDWTEIAALLAAFAIAVLATPAGISGAVLLLPFQVSVLGTPSPAVTPTNLLYNVVATPGALYRYWRQGQAGGRLALVLIAGTMPGVIAGSVIRVDLLPGPGVFDLVVAAVLLPLGLWLALTRPPGAVAAARPAWVIPPTALILLATAVGCVGGIYGIGGGSILAPVLIGTGRPAAEVAPGCPGVHVRHLRGGRRDLHDLVPSPARLRSPRLADRHRARRRRAGRRLHRRPDPVPAARCDDPPLGRRPRRRHRRSLSVVGRPALRQMRLSAGRLRRHAACTCARPASR